MAPLLKDLHSVHSKGLIHRDITPDNLLIGTDNRLHLIDFGSANHSNIHASKTFTVILKAGYAPPEQYSPKGKIGPWTDVYGCSAVMYYALTGHPPMDSLQRMQHNTGDYESHKPSSEYDPEDHLSGISGLPLHAKKAIIKGLSLSYKERYPSTRMLYNALTTFPVTDDTPTKMLLADPDSHLTIISSDNRDKDSHYNTGIITQRRKYIYAALLLITLVTVAVFTVPGIINNINDQTSDDIKTTDSATSIDNNDNEASDSNIDISDSQNEASTDIISDKPSDNTSDFTNPGYNYMPENNSEILTMVNLIGKDLTQAENALKVLDSDIEIQTIEEYSKTYKEGTIIAQSIQSNTQFTKGNISTITLTISLGDRPTAGTDSNTNTSSSNGTSSASTAGTGKSTEAYKVTGSRKNDGYTTIHIGE